MLCVSHCAVRLYAVWPWSRSSRWLRALELREARLSGRLFVVISLEMQVARFVQQTYRCAFSRLIHRRAATLAHRFRRR